MLPVSRLLLLADVAFVFGVCPGTCPGAKMWAAAMEDMSQYKLPGFSCKPDVDFMAGMIGHHAGAIAMCQVLYALTAPGKVTSDPLIAGTDSALPFFASPKSMCYNVTTSQTAEVKAMYEYLAKNGYPTPDKFEGGMDCPTSKAYLKNQEKMMAGMTLDYTCDPTVDFMSGMLAHHTGAIGMCKVVTDAEASGTSIDPEVAKMCQGVVAAQSSEIGFMTKWLKDHGYPEEPLKCKPMAMLTAETAPAMSHAVSPSMAIALVGLVGVAGLTLSHMKKQAEPSKAPAMA